MTKSRYLAALCGSALFVAGTLVGSGWNTAQAQDQDEAEIQQAWEITHAPYGSNHFYVVKHNQITGETRLLDARNGSDDDGWRTPMTIPASVTRQLP